MLSEEGLGRLDELQTTDCQKCQGASGFKEKRSFSLIRQNVKRITRRVPDLVCLEDVGMLPHQAW